MAYKLQLKRGLLSALPVGISGEPLFTTDTNDLYISNGTTNQKFQKFIASGTSSQFLKGDGSLDSTTYQPLLTNPVTGTGTTNYLPKWTSGSALGNSQVFDNGTNVGIGLATPTRNLDVNNELSVRNSNDQLLVSPTGTGLVRLFARDFTTFGDVALGFFTGVTERARISTGGNLLVNSSTDNGNRLQVTGDGYFSGNVGIGTATALGKLHVVGNGIFDDGVNGRITIENASGQNDIYSTTTGFASYKDLRYSAAGHIFRNGATETMRLTSTGNLGLGVTPSAWGSNWKALELSNGVYLTALSSSAVPIMILGANAHFDNTNFIYKTTAAASRYQQDSGVHYWYNAPSGTAGNAITFTQAMTLDASGRLGIGTTSPATKLQVNGTFASNSLWTDASSISYWGSYPTAYGGLTWDSGYGLIFASGGNALRLGANGTNTYMIINTSGNVGIGTTSPSYLLDVNRSSLGTIAQFITNDGTYNPRLLINGTADGLQLFATFSSIAGALMFGTGNTEKMRITSGGNLLVGTNTDSGEKLQVSGNGTFGGRTIVGASYIADLSGVGNNCGILFGPGAVFSIDGTGSLTTKNLGSSANPWGSLWAGAATFSSSVTASGIASLGIGETTNLAYIGDRTTVNTRYIRFGRASALTDIVNIQGFNGGVGEASIALQANGSNVLVGTTTDSGEKLQVNGSGKFSGQLTASSTAGGTSAIFQNTGVQNSNGIELRGGTAGTAVNWKIEKDNTIGNAFQITPSTTNGGTTYTTPVLTIASTGAATFSNKINFTPIATPSSPSAGDVYYDSTSNKLRCYNGTSWNDLF